MSSNPTNYEAQIGELLSGIPESYKPIIQPRSPFDSMREILYVQPTGGSATYGPNTTVNCQIPSYSAGNLVFLDKTASAHRFSVAYQTTAAVNSQDPLSVASGGAIDVQRSAYRPALTLDNSAYSLISQSIIRRAGVVWEQNDLYNQYANMYFDCYLSQSERKALSTNMGFNDRDVFVWGTSLAAAPDANNYLGLANIIQTRTAGDRSGQQLTSTINAAAAVRNYNYFLPIMSGTIGVNASKCLCLSKFASVPIEHQLRWEIADNALVSGTLAAGATFLITKYELVLETVTIRNMPSTFMQLFDSPRSVYAFKTYSAFTYTIPALTSNITIPISISASSVTGIFIKFRDSSNSIQGADATYRHRLSSTVCPNLNTWVLRLKGQKLPAEEIVVIDQLNGKATNCYGELQKALGLFDNNMSSSGFSEQDYNVNEGGNLANTNFMYAKYGAPAISTLNGPVAAGPFWQLSHKNSFHIARELEVFSNQSSIILSGISITDNTFNLQLRCIPGQTIGANAYTADIFVTYDALLVVDNGTTMVIT